MLSALALGLTLVAPTPVQDPDHDARMKWWRDARYGMFIHWGLYSIPAGVWNGKDYGGAAEWLLNTAQITRADYEKLQAQFNPTKFNAHDWVKLAKDSGMKYIVITSKHHEGFAMWPSKIGTWNIGHTAFKRDPLKELAAECKKQGIKLCFYHSIMDWHHPDYLPRRSWDNADEAKADFDRYLAVMKGQLKELLSGDYGDIGILWFDGEWEGTWTHERGQDLYKFVRSLQPNIIVNNRVDTGRGGTGGMSDAGFAGDYGTPEQEIPGNGLPGIDWESCMTMNNSWGFAKNDHDWKSSTTILTNLIDCASKGGNYLLNVGPTAEGLIPEPSQERLLTVGKWLAKNGEAIYGTTASPFPRPLAWGRVTQKPGKLYLMVFDKGTAKVNLPGLKADITSVHGLHDSRALPLERTPNGVVVTVPKTTDEVPVYVVEVKGAVSAENVPVDADANGTFTLGAVEAIVDGRSARYEGGSKDAIGYWTSDSDKVVWDINVATGGKYAVGITYACEPGNEGSAFTIAAGSGAVKGIVQSTGSWEKFVDVNLGSIDLVPGRQRVIVSVDKMPKDAVMNLRTLKLVRIP